MNAGLNAMLAVLASLLMISSIACSNTPADPTQVNPTPTAPADLATPADPTQVSPTPTAQADLATPADPTQVSPIPTTPADPATPADPTQVSPTSTTPADPATPADPTQISPTPTTPADIATPTPDGQEDAVGDAGALEEARAQLHKYRLLWTSNRVDAYSFVLAPVCFCPQHLLDPVRIHVVNGSVASVTYVESGQAPEHDGFGRYVTIDDLFDTIQEAIDGNAFKITVTYDPEIGYPTEASIDYDARMADEEYGFATSDYLSADGQ